MRQIVKKKPILVFGTRIRHTNIVKHKGKNGKMMASESRPASTLGAFFAEPPAATCRGGEMGGA
jgi:hypothetical protein